MLATKSNILWAPFETFVSTCCVKVLKCPEKPDFAGWVSRVRGPVWFDGSRLLDVEKVLENHG
ncbi:MAG: hypothetical protein CBE00_06300 [Planctomycetaceae bacterium TMED240]|nr:hypothetical protein [Rhodopirellula sp.]OUX06868.1 MAG: hypothetical protein CBE00_06300 [Planctomycetaceae bacterium TMED240]